MPREAVGDVRKGIDFLIEPHVGVDEVKRNFDPASRKDQERLPYPSLVLPVLCEGPGAENLQRG